MDYQEFKTTIVKRLQDFFGKDAEVTLSSTVKNNKQKYDGICISFNGSCKNCVPVIYINHYFEKYKAGELNLEDCISEIVNLRERSECPDDIKSFASHITEWQFVKEDVYPMLLSTAENQELLESLVSNCFLDLSVVYFIRGLESTEGLSSVKITNQLLEHYEISKEELHRQAIQNMEKDGYEFQDMESIVGKFLMEETEIVDSSDPVEELEPGKMYVLTNPKKMHGAAGILSLDFLMERLGNTSCFVLPSSIHELIFIPATEGLKQSELDSMVKEVNATQVEASEVLADHSYYYDAKIQEFRICA